MDELKMKNSLRRLTALFAVVCLLIVISAGVASSALDRMYQIAIDQQMEEKSEQYRINLLRKVEADLQTLNTLASFMEFSQEFDTDQFINGLYKSNHQTNFIRMGYFTRGNTGVRVTFNGPVERNLSLDDLHPEARAAAEKALQGESVVSRIYFDENLNCRVAAYSVPIYSGGEITGVLAASQSTDVYSEVLARTESVSHQGCAVIVSQDGHILIGEVSGHEGEQLQLEDIPQLDHQAQEWLREKLLCTTCSAGHFVYNKVDYHIFVTPLGIYEEQLVVIDAETEISTILANSINVTRWVTVALLAFAALFGLFAYRKIRCHNNHLLNLAYRDTLTGVYNMEKFNQMLEGIWSDPVPSTVVALNIRRFKFVNELFGAAKSDQLLKIIGQVVNERLTSEEFLCRETADSFFILLKGADRTTIRSRLEQIFREIDARAQQVHPGYPVQFYCGAASTLKCVRQEDQTSELMTHVMFALMRAKEEQQTTLRFYDQELHKKELMDNYIHSHMEQALADGEFRLFLQPKMDLVHHTLGGAEALVRWITGEGTMIFPDQFIPLFESNGFCVQLDLYMVEQVCRQLRQWMDQGLPPVPVSVNQTKRLFYEEGYVEKLCAITQRYQVPPRLITLEILEGLALEHAAKLNDCIAQLQSHGFRVSMDDFGSGFSSLNTLGKLKIDELKLDRVFLMAAAGDREGRQRIVMEQIITMANRLHIRTVAEGVETQEDEAMITALRCDYGQGYYYSRPISAQEFQARYLMPPGAGGEEKEVERRG